MNSRARRVPVLLGRGVLFAVVALVLALCGCRREAERTVAALVVRHGSDQLGPVGSICSVPLMVEVLGPVRRGILGGQMGRRPVAGVRVVFTAAAPELGPEILDEREQVTDEGGAASVRVRLGPSFGDQYVIVRLPDNPGFSARARFVAGVSVLGNHQETVAGSCLPAPMSVVVTDTDGAPLSDVPVHFRLSSRPGRGGTVSPSLVKTDAAGSACADLKTASGCTGRYEVTAEIDDPARGLRTRGFVLEGLAIDRFSLIFGVLGGLGIFIFGMKLMSEGLQAIAGPRLKTVLQFFARNAFVGVLAGAGITALIQSSSACTVMVVGFVNAGLLTLQQSLGIIFGAAIGTTVTGQMVSLKLDTLALPAIAVGVTMALAARRSMTRNLAQTLIGFGLLFLGMTMMSDQLKELSHFPSFVRFFSMFDCEPRATGGLMPWTAVLGALAIGTVLTMVVQSSSATIGLTIALATSGLLNFYTAVPLILGDNIGTTITALLASIGTNRPARRAAVAHTVFKMIGAVYMVALLYVRVDGIPVFLAVVDAITSGEVFAEAPENIGRHVAAAHTLFNVINVLVFLPFTGWLTWLCERLIPAPGGENGHIQLLEPHLLNTPSIALLQVRYAVGEMCCESWETTRLAFDSLTSPSRSTDDEVRRREERIDQMQRDTIDYLVKLTQRQLTERESEAVPKLMHCVNDAERVGDHAINVLELSQQIRNEGTRLSRPATGALEELLALVEAQAAELSAACRGASVDPPVKAIRLEGEIHQLVENGEQKHERRLRRGKCSVDAGIAFVELLSNVQRIGEHYGNIAQRIADVVEHDLSD